MPESLVQFAGVTRRFGDLIAVNNASLDIRAGEVLAILGENGAGKSTLMKMLYGLYPASEGQILLDGAPAKISGPADAMRNGIGMVFQHFSLLPALSVRDNLLLSWPKTPFWKSHRNARTDDVLTSLAELAPQIDPERIVSSLSVGEQQLVELCKVLNINARLVILDEPTSVLTPAEATRLHGFIKQLAGRGVAVALITHKLADVEACADRIVVMRRGSVVDIAERGARSMAETVALMMGQSVDRTLRPPPAFGRTVPRLVLENVSAQRPDMSLQGISLSIAAGEIVGVAGVAGNGQALLAEAVAGVEPLTAGDILLDGVSIARHTPFEAVSTPLGYIPEQPRDNGVVATMSLARNLALRDLAQGKRATGRHANLLERFNVNPPDPAKLAGTLSGGNVQKLVIARELGIQRDAILACYPTMGLDLAAIEMVYAAMFAQAASGAAVLWISEDLDDLLAGSHRIAVMREGRLVALLDNDGTLSREAVGALMTGMTETEAAA
ncbi:ATP-binding cassette domain-containing protein [Devosia sp. XJ19-1]|uniref:ATP-binding cassette domain-containing protein n=1 Tax=Devosia ureilytica TaxID=2952754 RepID=A0A9Q4ALS6_9HYPH|nr:ATP-binding cassette domain-containing protein [Devosia ureilytica]MCP8882152.1 ATP-binding cassette domain-containing protein [Devosia ureilytica]MCP8885962.1 ATP-binding cassette domain-containing protein [Devosia ureilytica]